LPEIVTVEVPVGDAAVVVIVRVELAEPFAGGVTDAGLSAHVVDAGQPLTVRATELLNPFREVIVTVEGAPLPCTIVTEEGLAESEKSCAGPPQLVNLNDPTRVLQLNEPSDFRYSLMYQNVQSSEGSMRKAL
jgi:hypothetical protein